MAGSYRIVVNGFSGNDAKINSDLATIGVFIRNILLSEGHTISNGYAEFDLFNPTNGDALPTATHFDIPTETVISHAPSNPASGAQLPVGPGGLTSFSGSQS